MYRVYRVYRSDGGVYREVRAVPWTTAARSVTTASSTRKTLRNETEEETSRLRAVVRTVHGILITNLHIQAFVGLRTLNAVSNHCR